MSGTRRLEGRTAVITGSSRGIGASIARTLAAHGAAVMLSARSDAPLARLRDELRGLGHDAHAQVCDVTDEQAVSRLRDAAMSALGGVEILVNNAGIATSAPLHRISLRQWQEHLSVNATGTFLCTRAFAPAMAENGWGRIINIASLAARTGARYIAAYAASKHAVLGLTRCVAAEMAEHGVTVNAVCPGYVDTDMTTDTLDRIVQQTGLDRARALESILATTPQRRLIQPDEVAHVVLMLCEEAARGVNGQAIGIDGGEFLG